jgi:hypothetical protein
MDYIEHPHLIPISHNYLGMGYYVVMLYDPKCRSKKRYYTALLGGPNGYEVQDNIKRLQNVTRKDYITLEKALKVMEQHRKKYV